MTEILMKQEAHSQSHTPLAKPHEKPQRHPQHPQQQHATDTRLVTPCLVLAVCASLLGSSIPGGYCLGVINTPQEIIRQWLREVIHDSYGVQLTHTGDISAWAVIVSIFVCGAIVGASVGGKVTDLVGRRTALLANHVLSIASGCLLMLCKVMSSAEMLVLGRFTSGLCTGLATCIVPLYLSEVAPLDLRGVMGVVFPMGMCMGLVLSQALGLDTILGTESGWPFLLGGFLVLSAAAVLAHPLLPESPTYCYVLAQDETRALKELRRLRGDNKKLVEVEESALRYLMHQTQEEQGPKKNKWSAVALLCSNTYRLPLLLSMAANAAQQLSGVNAVFFYSTMIFRSAGLDLHQSQGASIGAAAINGVMSMLALPLVRHCRRRMLFLSSIVMCVVCQGALITALYLMPTMPWASYGATCALMAYVVMYGIGLGPIPFMLATELFPVGPRSVGISMGGTTNWMCALLVSLAFPITQTHLGEFSFLIFIAFSCLFGIFMYRCLPETFGRTVQTDGSQDEVCKATITTEEQLYIDDKPATV